MSYFRTLTQQRDTAFYKMGIPKGEVQSIAEAVYSLGFTFMACNIIGDLKAGKNPTHIIEALLALFEEDKASNLKL